MRIFLLCDLVEVESLRFSLLKVTVFLLQY